MPRNNDPAPLKVSVSSLRSNVSSLSAGGGSSFTDPADALRVAMTVSALLEHAPDPASAEDLVEVIELKVCDKQQHYRCRSVCKVGLQTRLSSPPLSLLVIFSSLACWSTTAVSPFTKDDMFCLGGRRMSAVRRLLEAVFPVNVVKTNVAESINWWMQHLLMPRRERRGPTAEETHHEVSKADLSASLPPALSSS